MANTAPQVAASPKKRRFNPKQFFIVFSPEGETAPVVVHETHKAAMNAAYAMAAKHPQAKFFVMGSLSRPCTAANEQAETVQVSA